MDRLNRIQYAQNARSQRFVCSYILKYEWLFHLWRYRRWNMIEIFLQTPFFLVLWSTFNRFTVWLSNSIHWQNQSSVRRQHQQCKRYLYHSFCMLHIEISINEMDKIKITFFSREFYCWMHRTIMLNVVLFVSSHFNMLHVFAFFGQNFYDIQFITDKIILLIFIGIKGNCFHSVHYSIFI